jgi:MFS family permease
MNKKQISMVTWSLLLANIMSGLDATIINTAIPAIVSDLHGIQYMGWIVACFLLGMSVSVPIWSKLGERMGNKFAFELSLVLFILGSVLEGVAPDIYFFLISRVLMGVGAGGMGSLPYVIVGFIYPNIKRRTVILSYIAASFSAACIAGPLVGGWIVDALSWHWVFYINVPLGLISIILSIAFYRDAHKSKEKVQFDKMGAFTLIAGLTCFLIGIQMLGLASNVMVALFVIVGIILLISTTCKGTTGTNLRPVKSNHTYLETNSSSRLVGIINGIKDCCHP